MKDIKSYIIKEDSFPKPNFDRMTPPIALLELMTGKSLEEVLPKVIGWPIIGVYNQYKDMFKDVDPELIKLVKD